MMYSDHKGEKLSPTEIDNNFREIVERLQHLEKCDFPSLGISAIAIEGNHLIFKGPGNVILGEAALPVICPRFRGNWHQDTDYFFQDWVHYKGILYVCHQTHTAQPFQDTYWQSVETRETPRPAEDSYGYADEEVV